MGGTCALGDINYMDAYPFLLVRNLSFRFSVRGFRVRMLGLVTSLFNYRFLLKTALMGGLAVV
jgi:hypothetical protein